ncbi:hypothetical protein OG741_28540 [Streptomyces sp. NBC_01410]|uniref:hypothetical protein n=1 Tax=Streptomyces sp. NBC_01410 TaxID=2903856 RepID=UPI00324DE470
MATNMLTLGEQVSLEMSQDYAALIAGVDGALLIAASVQLHSYRTKGDGQATRVARVLWLAPFPVMVISIAQVLWWSANGGKDKDPALALRLFLGALIVLATITLDAVLSRYVYQEAVPAAADERPRAQASSSAAARNRRTRSSRR